MIAEEFIGQGHPRQVVLKILGISRSSFYYKVKGGVKKRGRPASTHTKRTDQTTVTNEQVVEDIQKILSEEFVDYGYLKTTHALRQEYGYIINHKKVYNLMKEHKLLNVTIPARLSNRQWVKEMVPQPVTHFSYLEFDIKYIYISGARRNALLVTVIDVYSRWVLGHYFAWRIQKGDIITLFDRIFDTYTLPERIIVRNDNGSQMEATIVQQYFESKNVVQEFTKPATPEQNAHIESYHSIVERVICQRYEFGDYKEGSDTLNRFVKFYNYRRIHSGIGYLSPYNYLLSKGVINLIELNAFAAYLEIQKDIA